MEGTYSPRPALRDVSECTPCGGGRYCSGVGLTAPTGDCAEGFYCRESATSAVRGGFAVANTIDALLDDHPNLYINLNLIIRIAILMS